MPKLITKSKINKQLEPNNLTCLELTMLKGKLDFSLINKDINYMDDSIISNFNKKLFKEKKLIESNSYTFKILTYWQSDKKLIKLFNLEKNLSNINKELKTFFNIVKL